MPVEAVEIVTNLSDPSRHVRPVDDIVGQAHIAQSVKNEVAPKRSASSGNGFGAETGTKEYRSDWQHLS